MQLKDIGLGGLTVALLFVLGFNLLPSDTHFCRDLEIAKRCDRLSGTEKTCYPTPATTIGKKYCSSGWEGIAEEIIAEPDGSAEQRKSNSGESHCNYKGCF